MKFAIRCLLFLVLAATPSFCPAADAPCSIQVLVGEHKDVTVTFPCMSKPQLVGILSTFFGKGDEALSSAPTPNQIRYVRPPASMTKRPKPKIDAAVKRQK
jgi:hypothetical protein